MYNTVADKVNRADDSLTAAAMAKAAAHFSMKHKKLEIQFARIAVIGDQHAGKSTFLRSGPSTGRSSTSSYSMTTVPEVSCKTLSTTPDIQISAILIDVPGSVLFHQREQYEQVRSRCCCHAGHIRTHSLVREYALISCAFCGTRTSGFTYFLKFVVAKRWHWHLDRDRVKTRTICYRCSWCAQNTS